MGQAIDLSILAEAVTTASASTIPRLVSKNSRFLSKIQIDIERAANVGGATVWGANFLGRSNALRNDFRTDGVATTYQTRIPFVTMANYNYLLRISKGSRTGTVTVTANSATITGSGTAFTNELAIGDVIRVGDQVRRILSITSATVAIADEPFTVAAAAVPIALDDGLLIQTTDYAISNVGGFALVTLAAAAKGPANATLEVHFVVPVALDSFVTATVTFRRREADGKDVLWYLADATASPSATNVYVRPLGN